MARQNRSAARWDAVLDAAITVFNEHGYDRASVRDIAEASGLAKPSLYHYMTSKEDLLVDIITRSQQRLVDRMAALEPLESAVAMFRAMIYTHAMFNIEYASESMIFFRDFRRLPAEKQREIVKQRDAHEHELVAVLKEAQRRREVAPDADPRMAVRSLLGGANSISMWYRRQPGSSAQHVAASFADLAIYGVVGPTDRLHVNGNTAAPVTQP